MTDKKDERIAISNDDGIYIDEYEHYIEIRQSYFSVSIKADKIAILADALVKMVRRREELEQ